MFAGNIKLHKDRVSYVNVELPSTSAAIDESSYANIRVKPASLPANEDSFQPHSAHPESSECAEEAPYSNI